MSDEEEAGTASITSFNDNPNTPKSLLARVWNRAMARLGYVVNNPEAKTIKRKLRT